MKPLERIIEAARSDPRRIVMAEGEDPRIVEGACRAAREGLAHVTLVGDRAVVEKRLAEAGFEPGLATIEDP